MPHTTKQDKPLFFLYFCIKNNPLDKIESTLAVIDAFIVEKSKYREQIGAVEVASRLTCDNVINLKLSYTPPFGA